MARILLSAIACLLLFAGPGQARHPDAVLHEVVIEGNTRTQRSVIERVMDLDHGAPFDLYALDRTWDRLEDCGYFAFVDLATEEDEDGRVTLYVSVEEDQTTRYTPYVRYSARHKYLLGAALRDINLRGRGEVLELQAIGYRIQRGQAAWTKPWLLGRDHLSLTVDGAWEQGPFVWRPFDYRQWHGRLTLRQGLTGGLYAEAGGGFESFRQRDGYDWALPDRGDQAPGGEVVEIAAATRDGWVGGALLGLDTRDNPYYPHRGMFHTVSVTRRTGGGGRDATFYGADARLFFDLPGSAAILALHAAGRTVDGPVAIEHGLFWGGAETVRGAPYARREGEHGYLLSAEVRWPLFLLPVAVTGEVVGLGLHGFFDAGDAWFDGDDPGRALQSYGAGVHLNLLTWQLRFEAARERDHGWSFQFMDVFNF